MAQNIRLRLHSWILRNDAEPPMLAHGLVASELESIVDYTMSLVDKRDSMLLKTDRHSLKVQDVRAFVRAAKRTPWGDKYLLIISDAERLTVPSANTLLKTLEELPPYVRFLLTTRWRLRILPTLLSRCLQLYVPFTNDAFLNTHPSQLFAAGYSLPRLALARGNKMADEELEIIAFELAAQLRAHGPSPELRRAFLRLRDYYRVGAQLGANKRMALEVLAASLPEAAD